MINDKELLEKLVKIDELVEHVKNIIEDEGGEVTYTVGYNRGRGEIQFWFDEPLKLPFGLYTVITFNVDQGLGYTDTVYNLTLFKGFMNSEEFEDVKNLANVINERLKNVYCEAYRTSLESGGGIECNIYSVESLVTVFREVLELIKTWKRKWIKEGIVK